MTSLALQLAPTGTLRVGVWTVPFFAQERGGALHGLIPDLGAELARRLDVPVAFSGYASPNGLKDAFRAGTLDVTFVGITADRADVMDFGPVVFEIQTGYLVPAASGIASMADIDRPGVRIAIPAPSAQEAHLRKIIAHATLAPVAPENPKAALDLVAAGKADAFSHVKPMLASVQGDLPGARILSGSYFSVPIAIGVARGRAAAVEAFARTFAEDVKSSGFVQQSITRNRVTGVAVAK
jgi:polar amino acid transport system substrate-binding protein